MRGGHQLATTVPTDIAKRTDLAHLIANKHQLLLFDLNRQRAANGLQLLLMGDAQPLASKDPFRFLIEQIL